MLKRMCQNVQFQLMLKVTPRVPPFCLKKWISDKFCTCCYFPIVCTKSNCSTCQNMAPLSIMCCNFSPSLLATSMTYFPPSHKEGRKEITVCGHRMAHRKWKEIKQQPSMLPGPAVPGCSLVSLHFLWANCMSADCTEWMEWMLHRKRRETKKQPSMLPGPAVPGCCLVSTPSTL